MTTVREFGGWIPVSLTDADVAAVRRTATDLKERLGLRETPLIVRISPSGPQLKARHVAGFVQVGQVTIEVAPKFLMPSDDASWRDAFMAILARLGMLTSMPRVAGTRSETGLPDLMGLVIDEALARAATEGLPRHYDGRRDDLASLRGQIDTERLWRRFVDPDLVPCRFDVFTDDTPAARLLKWAAAELSGLVSSSALATQLRIHSDALRHVIDESPSDLARDRIRVPPQYGYLDDAIDVAKMLASGDALSMSMHREASARAFLWNTAEIFEDFVFETCRMAMFKAGGVATKNPYPLATPMPGLERTLQGPVPTTPDVVVSRGGWNALIDAKYKTLKKHPRTGDIYQVMAGARIIQSPAAALMYPAWRLFQRPRSWRLQGPGDPKYLHALPFDLTKMAHPGGFNELVDRVEQWFTRWRVTGGSAVTDLAPRQMAAV